MEQRGQDIAKSAFLHGVAQIAQAFEQRDARARDVTHMDAERHQIAPGHPLAAGRGVLARQLDQGDEVEPHALQAQLEIDVVDGRQRAPDATAGLIDGAVVEERHG